MASSGWIGEQFLVTRSSNISYYGNLYISSITRSGTNVTVNGKIRLTSKGTSGYHSYYNYGIQADPAGSGGFVTLLGNNSTIYNGDSKDADFSTVVSNVSASATSMSFSVRYAAWYNSGHTSTYWDVTKSWTIYFESGGTAPSGLTAVFSSATDTTATISGTVASYGNPATADSRYFEIAVLGSSTYTYTNYRMLQFPQSNSAEATITNSAAGTLVITPNTEYHYGCHADNTQLSTSYVAPDTFVTLPAYITDVTATVVGGGVVNIATQHGTEGSALTVRTEYSWDMETWTTVSDPFNVTINSRKTIYVRRSSDAGSTPYYELEITPSDHSALYGSVNNLSKTLRPLYASYGNYFDAHHWLPRNSYASVDISGDDITITKVSSGSGTMNYIFFLIDATDEIINKEVTISGDFITGGSYTSGPRLFWMKSDNVNWLSLVSGMEYAGTGAQHFSLTGTIPSRPSGAGKLGLGLYSNQNTAAQGAYTIYRNVELKANVKNMFNYLSPRSIGGLTTTLATDGTLTITGVLSANYQTIVNHIIITDLLEDGVKYTLSAANGATADMCVELRGRKTGTTTYSYWNTRASASTTVTIDKTTYDQYAICVVTSTTASWGTSSKTVSNKFQLEKGGTATSFAPFVDTKSHKLKKVYGSVDGRSRLIYLE